MTRRRRGVTQRITVTPGSGEKRDCLAHDWRCFLAAVGVGWLALPNHPDTAIELADELNLSGVILTGGDDIGVFPERDVTETALIKWCRKRSLPLLGICRGAQMLHHYFGGKLIRVAAERHVAARHWVDFTDAPAREVNSFHNFSPDSAHNPADYPLLATGHSRVDDAVEMLTGDGMLGALWHPEREAEPHPADIIMVRDCFNLD